MKLVTIKGTALRTKVKLGNIKQYKFQGNIKFIHTYIHSHTLINSYFVLNRKTPSILKHIILH